MELEACVVFAVVEIENIAEESGGCLFARVVRWWCGAWEKEEVEEAVVGVSSGGGSVESTERRKEVLLLLLLLLLVTASFEAFTIECRSPPE